MKTVVLKFGGTSVGNIDRIKNVAKIIASYKKKKIRVIVVSSAISGITNQLIKQTKELSKNFDPAEDPKNVIYGSDAYTPRMPEGKNKYLDNADELMEADYLPLFEKYDITDGGPRVDFQNDLKDFDNAKLLPSSLELESLI